MIPSIRPVADADIREFNTWTYESPYEVYNIDMDPQEAVEYFLRPDVRCHAITEGEALSGYCTLGHDAQVPGGDYAKDWLDIGLGVRPDRTGRGRGHTYVETVIAFAWEHSDTDGLRVTIANGNKRAIRVWENAGFEEISRFETERSVLASHEWVILGLAR